MQRDQMCHIKFNDEETNNYILDGVSGGAQPSNTGNSTIKIHVDIREMQGKRPFLPKRYFLSRKKILQC